MKLSSRECFPIGVLSTLIIWVVALEVFIWPCRARHQKSRELMESRKQEAAGMEFYLSHYNELEQKLNKWGNLRNKEDLFYRNIDDTSMDRNLQAMAARVGVSIRRMSIGEAVLADFPYDTEMDASEDSGKEASGNGPAGGTVMESVIAMEIECPDAKGVMTLSGEIYREQKSILVSFLGVEVAYENGEGGQGTYQGVKGITEVRYYYEEVGQQIIQRRFHSDQGCGVSCPPSSCLYWVSDDDGC